MFGNWVKTFMLMAAITALFGVVGGALGGSSGMLLALAFAGCMNALSIRGPNGKIHAGMAIHLTHMGTQFFIDFPMLAGVEQVPVKVADHARYSVWILHFNSLSARIRKSKSVLWRSGIRLWHQSFVQPGWMDTTHRSSRRIAFVKQPCLIKSWKITSHGNGSFAINMNGMWA